MVKKIQLESALNFLNDEYNNVLNNFAREKDYLGGVSYALEKGKIEDALEFMIKAAENDKEDSFCLYEDAAEIALRLYGGHDAFVIYKKAFNDSGNSGFHFHGNDAVFFASKLGKIEEAQVIRDQFKTYVEVNNFQDKDDYLHIINSMDSRIRAYWENYKTLN